jgi:hypothetical protein
MTGKATFGVKKEEKKGVGDFFLFLRFFYDFLRSTVYSLQSTRRSSVATVYAFFCGLQ